jgi:hypothetical protein
MDNPLAHPAMRCAEPWHAARKKALVRLPFLSAAGALVFALACQCGNTAEVGGTVDAGESGDGATPGGDSGSSADGGDGGCGSVVLQGSLIPGNVVVVFDQSLSMNQAFGDAGPKYKVASEALLAAVTPLQGELNLGAIFQPTAWEDAGVCPPVAPISQEPPQIPIMDGGAFIAAWGAHFEPPWKLLLGTPLGAALDQANSALMSPPPGKTAVVVMTDGEPNCGESLASILAPVQAMSSRGIPTFVVGLPGASGAKVLMDLADAGGTGSYLLPADGVALQTELSQIASNSLDQCTIQLVPPPPDPTQVHLVVTSAASGNTYQIAPDAGGGGWSLSNASQTAMLLGGTCATAEDGGFSKIEFDYGCVSIPYQ